MARSTSAPPRSVLAALLAVVAVLVSCSSSRFQIAREDGRFTIGAGGQRLMYGYPVPYSTSHFVLDVDGSFAANTPAFPSDRVTYLHNPVTTVAEGGSASKSVAFEFDGVRVTQRLVPVDRTFTDVRPGEWGQYYRIEYEIENLTDDQKSVGLMLLIDTMIGDNDASQMDADHTRVRSQTRFRGDRVPGTVLVYHTPGNSRDLTAALVTDQGRAIRPDELFIGRWPELHTAVWEPTVSSEPYFDSAIILKWDEQTVAPHGSRYVATHYGLPHEGHVQVLTESPSFRRAATSVYFDFASDELTPTEMAKIDALLDGVQVSGAFVDVYSDAVGDAPANLALSKRRAEAVERHLESRGVPPESIVPKSHGETEADQSAADRQAGKREDRRADIVLYVEE